MPGNSVYRTHREGVIAAEEDRDRPGLRHFVSVAAQCPAPALDFPVIPGRVRRSVTWLEHLADREVAMVCDVETKPLEHGQETGRPQCRGAHQSTALRRSDIDRRAEHG